MAGDGETDSARLTVLAELQNREPIFHRPELGTTRADFEAMTAEDFWEVGASGRVYSRERVLAVLEQRHADPTWRDGPFQTSDFNCQCLAPDVFLFTYSLNQKERLTRRATVWRRSAGRWIALYHQGTLVSD